MKLASAFMSLPVRFLPYTRRLFWVGIYFLSTSWLFLIPIVFVPNYWIGTTCVILGALFVTCCLRSGCKRVDAKLYLFLIPLSFCAIFIPFPYNVGFILTASGMSLIALVNYHPTLFLFGYGLILSGIVMVIQAGVFLPYQIFAARYHQIAFLTPLFDLLIKVVKRFGIEGTLQQGIPVIQIAGTAYELPVSWEKLGLYPLMNMLVGGSVILGLSASKRKCDCLFFICISYAILRYLGITFAFLVTQNGNLFWAKSVSMLSFLPLAFILCIFQPIDLDDTHFFTSSVPSTSKRDVLYAGVCGFVLTSALVGGIGFQDPGIRKGGSVLIDEKHSAWQPTTVEFDKYHYGKDSIYNYRSLRNYLESYYSVDINTLDLLSSKLLSRYDVLVIKTPTQSFLQDEIEAIVDFVRRGGGVWLISEHTDIFWISTSINPIAEQFGIRFRNDSTHDLISYGLSFYSPPKILPHVIVQRVPSFQFKTSCTIKAPFFSENVMIGYGLRAHPGDYSNPRFFGDIGGKTAHFEFGMFLQATAIKYGQGRVVAFSDSTSFCNYSLFTPGTAELVIGIMEWLNRKNKYGWIKQPLLALFVVAVSFACWLVIRRWLNFLASIVFFALLAMPISIFCFQWMNQTNYPMPKPRTSFVQVCFVQKHSSVQLPVSYPFRISEADYSTFFVWTQRLGWVPSVVTFLYEAIDKKADVIVLINPRESFTRNEILTIGDYIARGGKLLLLDGARPGESGISSKSTANEILTMFGMKIRFHEVKPSVIYDGEGRQLRMAKHAYTVEGGHPLLTLATGEAVLATRKRGAGIIAVMTDSVLFSTRELGGIWDTPNENQRSIAEIEFWMFSHVLGCKTTK